MISLLFAWSHHCKKVVILSKKKEKKGALIFFLGTVQVFALLSMHKLNSWDSIAVPLGWCMEIY